MNTRTLLVDASYLLKRSFSGAKDGYTKVGFMGGVYGFLTTIRKMIKDYKVNKIVLMWDGQNSGIQRYRLDPKYKSNRKDKSWYVPIELTDAEIKAEKEKKQSILLQKKKIQNYAEELFIRQVEVDEIEADDLIAYYCLNKHKEEEIIIYTDDQDFLQLLTLDVSIFLQRKKALIEAGNFFNYYPFYYKNALTMKILCGDDSDMITGVEGIGVKTLITNFPELIDSEVTVRSICKRSVEINEERKANKQKPLKALQNITKDVGRLRTNHALMNLFEPFINEKVIEEINELDVPLADEDRGGNNLYKMMMDDDFLSLYSNYGNYASYVEPFYQVISREKDLLKNYNRTSLNS